MKTANDNREKIIKLIENATSKIQIAVSWLTDEIIIRKLTEAAQKVKVELLLSCDPLNAAFRYADIRQLQKAGASVLKTGANFPGEKGFMHAKFMIIDGKELYGGSFNYTEAASYNYEVFGHYDLTTLDEYRIKFAEWLKDAIDYVVGFENPKAINELVMKQFKMNESFRAQMLATCEKEYKESIRNEITERENLIKQELKKEELRKEAVSLVGGEKGVAKNGSVDSTGAAVKSKPHRFYGGIFRSEFGGQKARNSYAAAFFQKQAIEKKFAFLRCRIHDDTLVCTGNIQPSNCPDYRVRIEFRAGYSPQVFILNHDIEPESDIHMYSNRSLCLYYPGDQRWKDNTSIAEHTIPWVYEWILYYELYKLTGNWEGDYVPHGANIQSITKRENSKFSRHGE